MTALPSRNLLTKPEVAAKTRMSVTSLWRLLRAGKFPYPVAIGERRIAWYEDEIDHWIATRPSAKKHIGDGA